MKKILWTLILSMIVPITYGSESEYWVGLVKDKIELGYPLLTIRGKTGFLSCSYIDVTTCDRTNEACAIVSGVMTHQDMLEAEVKAVSLKAKFPFPDRAPFMPRTTMNKLNQLGRSIL